MEGAAMPAVISPDQDAINSEVEINQRAAGRGVSGAD